MTVTAVTMIKRAMRIMTVLSANEEPTDQEAEDGLYALNAMMEAWNIERLMVYQTPQVSASWTPNSASMTMGTGGTFSATRPIRVLPEGNYFHDSNNSIDYPLLWLGDKDSYERILLKTSTSSWPQWLYVDMGYPLVTLYVWPVPTQTLTAYLNVYVTLQAFDTLTEAIALPPGYQSAIEYNLALWMAPEYGTAAKITPWVMKQATILKANLKNINSPDLIARIDPAIMGRGRPYSIYVDGPISGT